MTLLIYSENCKYCSEIIDFIKSNSILLNMLRFHNINKQGVPSGLTRVPALITPEGATVIGGDVKNYLDSLIPVNIESSTLGTRLTVTSLDGSMSDDMFKLDMYGKSLAPPMTRELEEKISKNVQDAYQNIKKP